MFAEYIFSTYQHYMSIPFKGCLTNCLTGISKIRYCHLLPITLCSIYEQHGPIVHPRCVKRNIKEPPQDQCEGGRVGRTLTHRHIDHTIPHTLALDRIIVVL